MKVTPVASPHAMQTQTTTNNTAARDRAIQRLVQSPTQGQAQEHPVQDANNISVEELGAIKAQTTETTDNSTTIEDTPQTPEVPKEEKAKEDPALSRQFAQLARQERALRAKAQQQDQALKAREAALAEREAKIASSAPDMTQYIAKDRFKADPLSVMAETGLSYEEVTQQLIAQQPTDPRVSATIQRLEAQIAELKQDREESKKTYTEQQQAAYEAAVKQITRDAKDLVTTDPEFELIKATGSVKDVVELIKKHHEKTGEVLSVEEAAREVENYLFEETTKLTNLDKIKKRMAQSSATTKPTDVKTPQTQKQTQPQMKTLTNATSSTRPLSARERAIAAMEGRLKS